MDAPHPPAPPSRARGFTLTESIIVLVVLGIASVGIATLTGNIFTSQAENRDLQTGIKLLQSCAEQVLATRRAAGYGAAYSCSTLGGFGFNAPTAVVDTTYTCPTVNGTQVTCRMLNISITPSTGGASAAPGPINLLLVQ